MTHTNCFIKASHKYDASLYGKDKNACKIMTAFRMLFNAAWSNATMTSMKVNLRDVIWHILIKRYVNIQKDKWKSTLKQCIVHNILYAFMRMWLLTKQTRWRTADFLDKKKKKCERLLLFNVLKINRSITFGTQFDRKNVLANLDLSIDLLILAW